MNRTGRFRTDPKTGLLLPAGSPMSRSELAEARNLRYSHEGRSILSLAGPGSPFFDDVGRDPYWSNVVLYLIGLGSNGGTTFTDSSSLVHTPSSVIANAVTTTSFGGMFGPSCMNFTNGKIQYADSNDWDMGSSDFTVEHFVAYNSTGIAGRCFNCGQADAAAANQTFSLGKNTAGSPFGQCTVGGTLTQTTGTTSSYVLNTVYHDAWVRDGNTMRLFHQGVPQGTQAVSGSFTNQTSHFCVGGLGDYAVTYGTTYGTVMAGLMQCFRLTKGVCRYRSAFSVPQFIMPVWG